MWTATRCGGGRDVVVFQDSVWGTVPMVKRVVGVGGDRVACCDREGRLTVDGRPVDEPYLHARGDDSQRAFEATRVPAGKLFLLGDNRQASLDSRVHTWRTPTTVPCRVPPSRPGSPP